MAIVYPCSHCGKQVTAPDSFGGHEVACPDCGETVFLPGSLEAEDLAPANIALAASKRKDSGRAEEKVRVRCDQCFQPYLVPPSAVDIDFDCPKCGHTFRVSAIALQVGRDPDASGKHNLKTSAASEAATLGDDLLVELSSLDEAAADGVPLPPVSSHSSWIPGPVRRCIDRTTRLTRERPIALAIGVLVVIAWTVVLLYFLW